MDIADGKKSTLSTAIGQILSNQREYSSIKAPWGELPLLQSPTVLLAAIKRAEMATVAVISVCLKLVVLFVKCNFVCTLLL